jgi:hypothetical protein
MRSLPSTAAHAGRTGRRQGRAFRCPAVHAERPAELPTQFDAEYQATLDDVKTDRLDRLNETIEG